MATVTRETEGDAADDEVEGDRWHRRGRTTIELRQSDGGEWLATQRGVDAEGRGPSAAAAAAAFCRAIDAGEG